VLVDDQADLAVARAAASLGVPFAFSSQASVPMEAWRRGDGNGAALVPALLEQRRRAGGELRAPRRGLRLRRDPRHARHDAARLAPARSGLGYLPFLRGKGIAQYTSDPVFMRKLGEPLAGPTPAAARPTLASLGTLAAMARAVPGGALRNLRTGVARAAVRRFVATYSRPGLTWDDLPLLRARTRLPIVLKGVLHPDDARRALDAGVDGVMVSNHGGRQVDGAVAALDALPAVADAVAGRAPVLLDSGVRGGADVLRAIALGATAVGVGRPYVYGLAIAGEAGVREVVANVAAELELAAALAGCATLGEVTRECLVPAGD
jgi:lactate 2-monooxygenase